jgi:hypothetical protein
MSLKGSQMKNWKIGTYGAAGFALLVAPGLLLAADPQDSPFPNQDSPAVLQIARIRVLDFGWDTRFNYMDREAGPVTDRGVQYRLRTIVRLDLQKNGRTFFVVRAETGKGFDNSWNNTGAGLGPGQWIFNVKSIALHRKFGNHFEAEAGGLDFDRGAGTDATYASGDGHMTGYRAAYHGQSHELPDRVSLTAAYVGDFDKPNFFSRTRMDRVNYVQVLAEQHFGEELNGSAELDSIHNVIFARSAVRYRRLWVFDDATLEAIARTTDRFRFGWSSSIGRRWGKDSPWRSTVIYSDLPYELYLVDGQRILLNRGELDVGKRLSAGAIYRLTRDCEAGVFAGRLLDSTPSKRWLAQVGLTYQFAGLLNRLLR